MGRSTSSPTGAWSTTSSSTSAHHPAGQAVIELLLEHPELMQRPVVFRGECAVVARPSEKVLELLD